MVIVKGKSGIKDFNPRPPWGGRQCPFPFEQCVLLISIHALRGEGDNSGGYIRLNPSEFQSTPSVGRATDIFLYAVKVDAISIHALRGEGD